MSQRTDCSALQAALQELIEFLGQTYTTVCEEVARAEYAVHADMRILRDLKSQLTSRSETNHTQQDEASSISARSSDVQSGLGASATTATSKSTTAPPAVAQHDKLQAVLAQARAIRGQAKSQANRSHVSSIQPGQTTGSVPGLVTTSQSTQATSRQGRITKAHIVTNSRDGGISSRHPDPTRPSSTPQVSHATQARQQLPEQPLPDKPSTLGKGAAQKASAPVQSDTAKESPKCAVPSQLPADFIKAINALRQPGAHAHTQSAAGCSRSAPAGSQAPFVNLQDTFDECVGSISEAGAAFHNTLYLDDAQAGVGADVLRSWADPDSQNWLRHSALVEAQLLLMQRLSCQLQACSGQQAGSNGSDQDRWEDILQLWQEVQQEYHALFETSAGDPDAVMRWRNRAMRFVLSSETDPAYAHQADSKRQSSSGSRVDKPAEAWLPAECWAGLDQMQDSTHKRSAENPCNVLLPPHVQEGGADMTMQYTDPAQLQTISRLQHQLQLYLLQQHVESKLAVSLLPLGRIGESGAAVGSPTSQQALAQIRLAHAFLCKGAAKGLCTIMQEQPE